MLKRLASTALAASLMLTATMVPAPAAEVNMRVLGWYGNQKQSTDLERPFWKNLDTATKGQFAANFRTVDEIGLKGFESLRTLQSGAFDVVSFQISFVGGEAPVLMGVDIPGVAFDFDEQRKVVDAYRPVMEANLSEKFGGKLLAVWPFPFQILYCKNAMTSLDDLKGQKVRVAGSLSSELVKQLGGAAVTLAGPEVYQALMQGVVDCAVTGSQYGNSNGWYEVTKSLNTAPIGGAGMVVHVARKGFWEKLTPAQQATLTAQMKDLEAKLWTMAVDGHEDGIRCNIGEKPCDGKAGSMSLVKLTDADRTRIKSVLKENVLPIWLKDCEAASPTCKADWAKTIGAATGIKF